MQVYANTYISIVPNIPASEFKYVKNIDDKLLSLFNNTVENNVEPITEYFFFKSKTFYRKKIYFKQGIILSNNIEIIRKLAYQIMINNGYKIKNKGYITMYKYKSTIDKLPETDISNFRNKIIICTGNNNIDKCTIIINNSYIDFSGIAMNFMTGSCICLSEMLCYYMISIEGTGYINYIDISFEDL